MALIEKAQLTWVKISNRSLNRLKEKQQALLIKSQWFLKITSNLTKTNSTNRQASLQKIIKVKIKIAGSNFQKNSQTIFKVLELIRINSVQMPLVLWILTPTLLLTRVRLIFLATHVSHLWSALSRTCLSPQNLVNSQKWVHKMVISIWMLSEDSAVNWQLIEVLILLLLLRVQITYHSTCRTDLKYLV